MKKIILIILSLIFILVLLVGCIDIVAIFDDNYKIFRNAVVIGEEPYALQTLKEALIESGIKSSNIMELSDGFWGFSLEVAPTSKLNLYTTVQIDKDQYIFTMMLDKMFDLDNIDVKQYLYNSSYGFGIIMNDNFAYEHIYINQKHYATLNVVNPSRYLIIYWHDIYDAYDKYGKVLAIFILKK